MIFREFTRFGRRFCWIIAIYVTWVVLATLLTSTHQAFVSESAGVRVFATEVERLHGPVMALLLTVFLLFLWQEDSIWERRGFWRTRPVTARDSLLAKATWLGLLGALLPGLSGLVTSLTAQMGPWESLAYAAVPMMGFAAMGAFVSGIVVVSRGWGELAGLGGLHLPQSKQACGRS